jgi:hypothetical protein
MIKYSRLKSVGGQYMGVLWPENVVRKRKKINTPLQNFDEKDTN